MKINKCTVGLVAAGLISLAVNAEEKMVTTPLLTALSSTTISGYIDTSAHWNPGTGNANPAPYSFNAGKQDGFNIDSVMLSVSKPLEEGQWSSGYQLDLSFGPDSGAVNNPATAPLSGFGLSEHVRQAYVVLRAPVGNGLDFTIGRFDTILGFESSDAYKNPNYTRSYGYTITPTEHTGVLMAYHVSDLLSLKAGVANTINTLSLNSRNGNGTESQKAYLAGLTLTAPDSAGFLKGSVLNVAALHGPTTAPGAQATDISLNGSLATPLEGLRIGATWDELFDVGVPHTWVGGAYASFRPAPESKLSFHARGEYYHGAGALLGVAPAKAHIWAATGTIQYDLWQNVISRLEVRWDRSDSGKIFGGTVAGTPTKRNDFTVAANVIYKF
ncbi:MAG: uncharacterized protein JWM68_4604 [Verrucomicrobiales bacterium]|nr:uncharacterized protein [Verrucomicrobiales bacterium]